jgi:hypothetical protein
MAVFETVPGLNPWRRLEKGRDRGPERRATGTSSGSSPQVIRRTREENAFPVSASGLHNCPDGRTRMTEPPMAERRSRGHRGSSREREWGDSCRNWSPIPGRSTVAGELQAPVRCAFGCRGQASERVTSNRFEDGLWYTLTTPQFRGKLRLIDFTFQAVPLAIFGPVLKSCSGHRLCSPLRLFEWRFVP